MTNDRRQADSRAKAFFEDLWKRGDPWNFETSEFEQAKYERQMALVSGRRYRHALEVGCGAGVFTRMLPRVADHIVGIDVSATAIERARALTASGAMEFRVANAMEYEFAADAPWDLIVMSETICYLGWLYSFFDVGWLAMQLFANTAAGGRLIMANTCGGVDDYLLRPSLIRTYRDLFVNVGYSIVTEEMFQGVKNGLTIDALITLFEKTTITAAATG